MGRDKVIGVRMTQELLDRIEAYRDWVAEEHGFSVPRGEIIRRLLHLGLTTDGPEAKKKP